MSNFQIVLCAFSLGVAIGGGVVLIVMNYVIKHVILEAMGDGVLVGLRESGRAFSSIMTYVKHHGGGGKSCKFCDSETLCERDICYECDWKNRKNTRGTDEDPVWFAGKGDAHNVAIRGMFYPEEVQTSLEERGVPDLPEWDEEIGGPV